MPYTYLEDIATADAAFEASGKTVEELFIAAIDATMNVMVEDLSSIQKAVKIEVELKNAELDMLLYNLLNELVYYKDAKRLLLRADSVKIEKKDSLFLLHARLAGEALDRKRHPLSADVKAVTLHRFSIEKTVDGWKATVVLDI